MTGPIINKAYIKAQEELEKKKEHNKEMSTATLRIGLSLLFMFGIFSFLFNSSPLSETGKAMSLAREGVFDPNRHTFEQNIEDKINEKKHGWGSYLDKEDESSIFRRNVDPGNSGFTKYLHVPYDQAPENIRPTFEVSTPEWSAQERSGDGDRTPSHYAFVIAKAHITVYRPKEFTGERIKVEDEDIQYGPFLVDTERKIYTYCNSTGALYEDFYNSDIPSAGGWEHYTE